MHALKRFALFVLATVFLIEAWLWDHLEPIVAGLVAWIPLHRLKEAIAARIETLSPAATLIVFAVPVVVLFPLKLFGVWLFARHHWFAAFGVAVFAKFTGIGVSAFLFDVTREKLLRMVWFRKLYDYVMLLRRWAERLVAPVRQDIEHRLRRFRLRTSSGTSRLSLLLEKRRRAMRRRARAFGA
jgi:hypothetical protein